MSREKNGKQKNDKTPATKTAKEKRAAKVLKRNTKRTSEQHQVMENEDFDEAIIFNLSDIIDYKSNDIVVKNIVIRNPVVIQYLLFDFGKVQVYKKSPFMRFIYIAEGKAEVVINNNSTFLQKGDSILIPGNVESSIEANQPFQMLCTTVKSEQKFMMKNIFKTGDIVCTKVNPKKPLKVRVFARKVYYCDVLNEPNEKEEVYFESEIELYNPQRVNL